MARVVIFINNTAIPWVLDELDGRVVAALGWLDVSSEVTDDEMMHAIQSGLGLSFVDDPNGRYLRINGINKTAVESLNYGNLAEGPDPAPHYMGGSDHIADTLANLNTKITDAQLDDDGSPRPPLGHAASHNGGGDPVTPAGIGAEPAFAKNTAFNKNFGAAAGDVCQGNDARLSNARPPTAHAADHNGGIDPVTPAGIGAEPAFAKNTAFNKNFGALAGDVCEGNDARLSNARTPTAHGASHTNGTDNVADLVGDAGAGGTHGLVPAPAAGDAAAGKYLKASGAWTALPVGGQTNTVGGSSGITNTGNNVDAVLTPTYGAAVNTICQGNDARLSDARTPLAHKDTHVSGAGDQFIATDLLEAIVKRLRETSGPTTLLMGSVLDGQVLQRSGTNLVGALVDIRLEATLPTVGNAWATIATIAIPDNTVVLIETDIVARRTDAADRAGYVRRALIYREAAGVATLEGTLDSPFTRESTNTWDTRIGVSGNNAIIEVRGGAGASVNWKARYKTVSVA